MTDLARHHLILGFMVPERPLSRRQQWFYLDHTEPVSVEVTLLTVADRLAEVGIRLPASSAVPCPDAPRDPGGTAPAAASADRGSRTGEP